MDNQAKLDQLFSKAKSETKASSSFSYTKEVFTSSVGVKKPIHVDLGNTFLIFKNFSIMMGLASLLGIVFFVFFSGPTVSSEINLNEKLQKIEYVSTALENEQSKVNDNLIESGKRLTKVDKLPFLNTNKTLSASSLLADMKRIKKQKRFNTSRTIVTVPYNDEYRLPVLTQQEIKSNHKDKKRLLKKIYKMFNSNTAYNPSGKYDAGNGKVSINAFNMMAFEMSNLDYRIFLFDLLIHGKEKEFLIAKPEQSKWTSVLGETMKPMETQYFSNDGYNLYPVVNVPPKGAELFCVWLSENMKMSFPDSKYKQFRIPTKEEWLYAATMQGKHQVYPWGGAKLYNESGCFLANFNGEHGDSTKRKNECFSEEDLLEKGEKASSFDGAVHTAKVFSYNPNSRNVFNLSGNVAELVYINSDKEFGTCGGGWMNTADEIKLNAPDPYEGNVVAHPNIGFRIVSTKISDRNSDSKEKQ